MTRRLSPGSTIVVGGHVSRHSGIEHMIDADHIVRGDGIAWMRGFLGEDASAPIRHPHIVSGFDIRTMGINKAGPGPSPDKRLMTRICAHLTIIVVAWDLDLVQKMHLNKT